MPSDLKSGFLFDMDGTLIDSEPLWLKSEITLMAEFDYEWSVADQIHCLGGPMSKISRYMAELSKSARPPEFFAQRLISLVTQALRSDFALVPGAADLLDAIRKAGFPMALVSASARQIVDVALDSGLCDYFPVSISSDDVLESKPHPEGYVKAAEELGISIEESIIFEDSVTGVLAAISSGAHVVAIPHIAKLPVHERVREIPELGSVALDDLYSWYPHLQIGTGQR